MKRCPPRAGAGESAKEKGGRKKWGLEKVRRKKEEGRSVGGKRGRGWGKYEGECRSGILPLWFEIKSGWMEARFHHLLLPS
jgi:hypothetical protein